MTTCSMGARQCTDCRAPDECTSAAAAAAAAPGNQHQRSSESTTTTTTPAAKRRPMQQQRMRLRQQRLRQLASNSATGHINNSSTVVNRRLWNSRPLPLMSNLKAILPWGIIINVSGMEGTLRRHGTHSGGVRRNCLVCFPELAIRSIPRRGQTVTFN